MTTLQKVIKYLAIAFAVFLTVSIIGGIISVVGLLGGLFSADEVLEAVKTYPVTSEIRSLDIEINAADLCIKEGDGFFVESNLKYLKVEDHGGLLTVQETKILTGTYTGAVLTVYIPAGTVFDSVDITTGAGRLTIGKLSAGTLDFKLGAGDVSAEALTATKSADIEGGAGRITIGDGALKDLKLKMGVGQLKLTSVLTGNCKLDMGMGESDLTLSGNRDDYQLNLEKGIGSIAIDGKVANGNGSSGSGANVVEINGGIGAIRVQFAPGKA